MSTDPIPNPARSRPRRRATGAVTAAVALVGALFVLSPGTARAEGGGTMTIDPASGDVGTAVTIRGTIDPECRPDSPVTVEIGEVYGWQPSPMGEVTSTVIGSADPVDGHFTVTGNIPATTGTDLATTPGTHEIHAYCYMQFGGIYPVVTSSTSFTVTGATPPSSTPPTTTIPDEATPGETPGGTVSASTITAGGAVSFTAHGFAPDSQVEAALHSDPVDLGTFAADALGHVAGTVTIPADVAAGDHTLVLSGTGADGEPLTVEIAITVVAPTGDGGTGVPGGRPAAPASPPAAPVTAEPRYNG